MISKNSVLAVIPARKGSKGLSGKNKKNLLGKPLIAWTIEEANKSKYIDRLIVSTDDDQIIEIARNFNCEVPFIRPDELAQDTTTGIDVALHAIDHCPGFDIILYLQPTSPLRSVFDIDKCTEILIENSAQSSVSVCEVDQSPHLMFQIDKKNQMIPILPTKSKITNRQEFPLVHQINGAVYAAYTGWIKEQNTFVSKNTLPYIMPKNRSVDIDDELDFIFAEMIAQII